MKKIYKYEGEYGIFEVNLKEKKIIRDELDREKIWADAQEDYINQQHIYGTIIDELFGDDIDKIFPPRHGNEYWCGEPTDFGYMAFNDDVKIIVDAEGSDIYDQDEWLVWTGRKMRIPNSIYGTNAE